MLGIWILGFWLGGCGNPIKQFNPDAPTVNSTSPADKATGVALFAEVVAAFNKSMAPSTITNSTFTLSSADGPVTGTVTYDASNQTATFIPSVLLTMNTKYTAIISDSVKSSKGIKMEIAYSWSFTTSANGVGSAAGILDKSFGENGMIAYEGGYATAITTYPSGMILVLGAASYGRAMTIWRFTTHGSPDATFNGNGVLVDNRGQIAADNQWIGQVIAIDPGKNILATSIGGLFRYNSSGQADITFGTDNDGRVVLKNGGAGNAICIDSDNRILVAGGSGNNLMIWRYNSDGQIDETFGDQGVVLFGQALGQSINTDASGRILVTGTTFNSSGDWEGMRIWRLKTDGTLDKTASYNASTKSKGNTIIPDSTGGIIVIGDNFPGGEARLAIWRYDSALNLDTTFGTDGVINIQMNPGIGAGEPENDLGTIDQFGKILVTGVTGNFSILPPQLNVGLGIWRYDADGTPDSTFGTDGKVSRLTSENFAGSGRAIAVDHLGRIVVVGKGGESSGNLPTVWRYK